jgi:iron(III) transport system ATP-binding protein
LNTLEVKNLSKKYAQAKDFAVSAVSLEVSKGEILAITGESGCGKTTLLRLIAGLEVPDDGAIAIYQQVVADKTTWVKPEKRKIGMVFQDYALFPHLTVQDNVAFGLGKNIDKTKKINEVLDLVGLQGYQKRYPHELSGGQQQRVALARALAPSPSILLLDEPFSNLDEVLKDQVREELLLIIQKSHITTLLVTHDSKDALTMADRIVVMQKGKIQQCDTPKQLYNQPENEYVAKFFGKLNFTDTALLSLQINKKIGIRPEHIQVSKEERENSIRGVVKNIHFFGAYQELIIEVANSQWLTHTTAQQNFEVGEQVYLHVTSYITF